MSEMNKAGDVDLRAIREAKGVTLDTISHITKIRRILLEAIETGDFQVLPERIYGEAFIKGYATQIGVDPEPIIARYRKFLKMSEPDQAPKKTDKAKDDKKEAKPEKVKPIKADAETLPEKKPESAAVSGAGNLPRKRFSRLAVSLVLSVVVICGGFVYFLLSDESPSPDQMIRKERPAAPSGETKVDQSATGLQQNQGNAATDTAPPATNAPSPASELKPAGTPSNNLVIQASELTWISITEDDNQPYQIMLRPGDNIERVAGRFVIDVGNAGGIALSLNGEDLGVPGQRGQVVHLILPPERRAE